MGIQDKKILRKEMTPLSNFNATLKRRRQELVMTRNNDEEDCNATLKRRRQENI